ncbi:MAG: hypothetical protein U0359_31705 [Byssovorax sp.]
MARPQRYALLGHPVAHSVSPAMCMAAFQGMHLSHFYTAMDVPSVPNLRSVVEDMRSGLIAGANVTVPYKRAVLDLCDSIAPSAEEVGAANVLVVDRKRRVIAHNTDADALTLVLGERLTGRPRMRAAVIGSGGAVMAAIVDASAWFSITSASPPARGRAWRRPSTLRRPRRRAISAPSPPSGRAPRARSRPPRPRSSSACSGASSSARPTA